MAFGLLLEMHHGIHANIYVSTNHIPFLWPGLISGILIIILSLAVMDSFGLLGIILVQFIVQLSFNNWFPVYLNLKLMNWGFIEYLINILKFKKI